MKNNRIELYSIFGIFFHSSPRKKWVQHLKYIRKKEAGGRECTGKNILLVAAAEKDFQGMIIHIFPQFREKFC